MRTGCYRVSFELRLLGLIEGKNPSYRGAIPVERLVFGSHAPFFPCESAVMKLFESPLRLDQLEKLMYANARRLVG